MPVSSESKPSASGPLSHLTVLDLSRILAGPWTTQILADLGARVIKVESISGDDTRRWGPPFLTREAEDASIEGSDAAYFTCCNRNKESVCVDFSKPEGAELIRKLAGSADILVENFKVGGLKKYGLDYASLQKVNPRLVYCSITGFGQTGPYASRAGYDFLIQGMGGLMSITGHPETEERRAEPLKTGVAITDEFTGMYAATSILAAIASREQTGEGQHIDCSLFDCQVAMLANQGSNWLVGKRTPKPMGNNHPNLVPYRAYPVQDGHVIIACGNDRQYRSLCDVLELKALGEDPRFLTNADRVANRAELESLLEERLAHFPRERIINLLEIAGVPCGPINTIPEVFEDPQVIAREMVVPMKRADGFEIPTVAFPAKFSGTPANYRSAPPRLGDRTHALLAEDLALDQATIENLVKSGVVA
ncbi:CaiB/BaiF CoA-transferase family protein [Marinobacter nanhaiticus D15-8W]|uniref:CoA transferase n=1 Tax=Marinobacter nanhaiticus D15-8W TaxID=626887 RepID=N6WTD0_9GAMM|nr:CaiB/BaiF CoA-transferase family protein [Marinobacter nanhaiticus]ENO14736.1 CoA transferase [Marinobacter nanhaiticus D15-8W]BES69576.1 CaiB/BaiF CoA-transferase family protein [Marinobacter nanhaiticus D15-8W]